MTKFNRSEFMKTRWDTAQQKAKMYEQISGETDYNKKSFLSDTQNPLDQSIVTYDVTTQMNYQSPQGGLIIQPKTFQVTAFRSHIVKENIENKTKRSLSGMKINGDSFNSGLQSAIESKASVEFRDIRGMEETKKTLSQQEYSQLLRGEFIVTSIDDDLTFTKGKGGKKYNAKQDLSEFM